MSHFFYIYPDNPQTRLIKQSVEILREGGVIVYPTDSGYALGCMIGNKQAMDRIVALRQLDKHHHFTLVCRDLSELSKYALVNNVAYRLIKNNTPGRYTFILVATKEVPRRLMNEKRKTIGIRVPDNLVALALLAELNEPILSCSLILPDENEAQYDPDEIQLQLGKQVDLILHGGYLEPKPTTVVDLTDDTPNILRIGSGILTPFQ